MGVATYFLVLSDEKSTGIVHKVRQLILQDLSRLNFTSKVTHL